MVCSLDCALVFRLKGVFRKSLSFRGFVCLRLKFFVHFTWAEGGIDNERGESHIWVNPMVNWVWDGVCI